MILYPFVFGFIVFLIFCCLIGGSLIAGFKLENRKKIVSYIFFISAFHLFIILCSIGAVVSDNTYDKDFFPTLVNVNESDKISYRKIIGFKYKNVPIEFKRGGSYYVENQSKDTIEVITAVYYTYSAKNIHESDKYVIIPPDSIKEVYGKPISIVKSLPINRAFRYRRHSKKDTYFATYILRK